jgi:signal transduction histidine kinase
MAIWLADLIPEFPYAMRAVYLALAGYVIGFFSQSHMEFEAHLRELESIAQRQKIARSLHDGYIQALAGVNLRLESCRDILACDQPAEALAELTELQASVAHEYDHVRAYVRSLVQADPVVATEDSSSGALTNFRVTADFTARGLILEEIFQIMLEGMRNTRRHGRARLASIDLHEVGNIVRITIDDDGVGFVKAETPPWTIASRVAEFGGRLKISSGISSGAHLEIEMPRV